MINLGRFLGNFRPKINNSVWGHGEYGYELTIFSSHDESEVKKALTAFNKLIKDEIENN